MFMLIKDHNSFRKHTELCFFAVTLGYEQRCIFSCSKSMFILYFLLIFITILPEIMSNHIYILVIDLSTQFIISISYSYNSSFSPIIFNVQYR